MQKCWVYNFKSRRDCEDTAGGNPMATEELRYGLRLSIICLPADPKLLTLEALKIVVPQAFGFVDLVYKPDAA